MVPVWNMLSSEANCLAYHQEFCVCECIRPPSPFGTKNRLRRFRVGEASWNVMRHHGMSCTTREGRPSCHEKAARVSTSGLVYPTLGYPARGPASWHRRSE